MYAPNPLRSLFDVFGRTPDSHVDGVNRGAFEQLIELLDVDPALRGRCILLRAPRAGYGKTHLLSLVARHFGSRHEFVLLTLADGSRMHPGSVLEDLLRQLCRPLPAGGGLTELDLVARRVLAMGLEPLVRTGEVPCQDRESALVALRDRATETFDFHHPNAVTAHWARDNFAVLGPRLGLELSQRVGAPLRESIGWVEAFYRFAATPVDQPARIGALIEAAGSGASIDRLGALLEMLSALRRVVLVADEIEGLSSDPESALRLAAFITSLRQTAEAVDVIVALNRDLWESAFRPRLSGGLEDRLAEWVIELGPLSEQEMESLLESRVPGHGAELAAKIDLDGEGRYARNVLRRGAELWEEMIEKEPPPQAPEPSSGQLPGGHAPSPLLTPAAVEASPLDQGTSVGEPEPGPADDGSSGQAIASWMAPAAGASDAAESVEGPQEDTAADESEDLDQADEEAPDAEAPPLRTAIIPEPRATEPRAIEPSPFMAAEEPAGEPGELNAGQVGHTDEVERDREDHPAAPAEEDVPEPVAQTSDKENPAPAPPAALPPPPPPPAPRPSDDASDSDRVDELLRQFRERYGRR